LALHCLGVDILGPFARVIGGYRYSYVTIVKSTMWPVAIVVIGINKASAVKYLKSIVCHFRVPN
jgi:hypothetical protein